jgi:hypothetical protein
MSKAVFFSKEQAQRITANVAKLPELLRPKNNRT